MPDSVWEEFGPRRRIFKVSLYTDVVLRRRYMFLWLHLRDVDLRRRCFSGSWNVLLFKWSCEVIKLGICSIVYLRMSRCLSCTSSLCLYFGVPLQVGGEVVSEKFFGSICLLVKACYYSSVRRNYWWQFIIDDVSVSVVNLLVGG